MKNTPSVLTRRIVVGSTAALGLIVLSSLLAQTPAGAQGVALPGDPAAPAAAPAAAAGRGGGGGRGGPAVPSGTAQDADFTPKDPVKAKTPAEEAKTFILPPGYRMEPVISDPLIAQPSFIEFDGNGRMYIGEMRSYMLDSNGTGEYEAKNRISRFESSKGDGVFDKHTVFVDNIAAPRAVVPLDKDRILVNETHSDSLDLYTDTNGDGVADKKEVFYTGVGLGRDGNIEHEQSGFVWAMDNWIYSTYNTFRFRWTPTGILKENISSSGGQWGMSMDDDGKTWNVNAGGETGPVAFQIPVQYGIHEVPDSMETDFQIPWGVVGIYDQQGGMTRARTPVGILNHFTATTGPDIFRGTALPDDLKGDLLFTEPVGRVIRRTKIVKTEGLTQLRNAYPGSEFIIGTDPLFRPVNLKTGPDGALYVVDMYHGIIQDTQWSRPGTYLHARVEQLGLESLVSMGRIWRVRYDGIKAHATPDATIAGKPGIPLNLTQPHMLDETPAQLVAHLTDPNGWWRDTAQRLLVLKQDKSVVPALTAIVRNPDNLLARFHALWSLEGLNAMPAALVREVMKDPAPRMRVQGIRASETLYKAGDRSFEADYRALMKDSDADVAIQALITANVLKVKDVATAAKDLLPKNPTDAKPPRGVVEFATWVGNGAPSGGRGGGGAPAGTPEQMDLIAKGTQTFTTLCADCHGEDGRGKPVTDGAPGATMAPSLAGSPRVQGHRDYVVKVLLNGINGTIDGKTYTNVMIPMGEMKDDTIAGVASYVRNMLGSTSGYVTVDDVVRVRAANTRTRPWTLAELQATIPTVIQSQPTWKFTASGSAPNANLQNVLNLNGWTLPAQAGVGAQAAVATGATPAAQPAVMSANAWFQIELPAAINLAEVQFNTGGGGRGGGGGGRGAAPGGIPGVTAEQTMAIATFQGTVTALETAATAARTALTAASFQRPANPADVRAKAAALGTAETALADARAAAFATLQASADRLAAGQKAAFVQQNSGAPAPVAAAAAGGARGGGGAAAPAGPARTFGVEVSANGTTWTPVTASARTEGTLTMLALKPTQAKFVRITTPAATATGWGMTNLRLLQAGQ